MMARSSVHKPSSTVDQETIKQSNDLARLAYDRTAADAAYRSRRG